MHSKTRDLRTDLVGVVESIYDLERDGQAWIDGILERLEPCLCDGSGLFGFDYVVTKAGNLKPGSFASRGCPTTMGLPDAALRIDPEFVRRSYLVVDWGAASQIAGWTESPAGQLARASGVLDNWGINGRNPGGRGFIVLVNRRAPGLPHPSQRAALSRIALHLAAAHRLRERLREADPTGRAEAVMSPGGKVCHAAGAAKLPDALDALKAGASAMERARGALRRASPNRAIQLWTTLTGARWTLVDHFERDGRRYILAQENESSAPPHAALSPRERQVLANAVLGRSNKEIAYALGIEHSTVRVLLTRASKKLGATNRSSLLQAYEALDTAATQTGEVTGN